VGRRWCNVWEPKFVSAKKIESSITSRSRTASTSSRPQSKFSLVKLSNHIIRILHNQRNYESKNLKSTAREALKKSIYREIASKSKWKLKSRSRDRTIIITVKHFKPVINWNLTWNCDDKEDQSFFVTLIKGASKINDYYHNLNYGSLLMRITRVKSIDL